MEMFGPSAQAEPLVYARVVFISAHAPQRWIAEPPREEVPCVMRVHAPVRDCVRACVRACLHACACACMSACMREGFAVFLFLSLWEDI